MLPHCTVRNPPKRTFSPPVPPPYVALAYTSTYLDTTTLEACCNAPVAPYTHYENQGSIHIPDECATYCNVTAPLKTVERVVNCVEINLGRKTRDFEIEGREKGEEKAPQKEPEKEPKTGGAVGREEGQRMGVIGFVVLGLGFVGAVCGML